MEDPVYDRLSHTAEGNRLQLAIPNLEIRSIFTGQILEMFQDEAAKDGVLLKKFSDALENGERNFMNGRRNRFSAAGERK